MFPILLAGGIGLIAMLIGGGWWMYDTGKDAQKEADRPKIEALTGRATLAEAANVSLQTDLDAVDVRVKACNARVDGLSSRGAGAKADIAAARTASNQRVRALESEVAHWQMLAATPTTTSAAQKCEDGTKTMDALADRARSILGIAPLEPGPKAKVTIK